jgi:hypothetical protein
LDKPIIIRLIGHQWLISGHQDQIDPKGRENARDSDALPICENRDVGSETTYLWQWAIAKWKVGSGYTPHIGMGQSRIKISCRALIQDEKKEKF